MSEAVKTKFVGDLGSIHGILLNKSVYEHQERQWHAYGEILLVGKDKQKGVTEFVFIEHALELFTRLNHTIPIVGVDHEDDALCVLEVVSPQWPNLILSTDIPYGKLNVLVLDCLNVKSCRCRW